MPTSSNLSVVGGLLLRLSGVVSGFWLISGAWGVGEFLELGVVGGLPWLGVVGVVGLRVGSSTSRLQQQGC